MNAPLKLLLWNEKCFEIQIASNIIQKALKSVLYDINDITISMYVSINCVKVIDKSSQHFQLYVIKFSSQCVC